ncbi:MAG: hypothetical protein LC106_08125 [Burkholderiales bacterium]|nr:hypothetical protein [Burkholderiales bacterium]
MAGLTWKDIGFESTDPNIKISRQRSNFTEPVNNVDLALGRFKELVGDYDTMQRERVNNELAKRLMGYSDPEALRAALADGSFIRGVDQDRVTADALSAANSQIEKLIALKTQDLANRTGQQSLSEAIYKDDRLRRANAFRDNNIGSLQQGVLLGSKGDIAGQGSNVAALDFTNAPYEAMDAWTKDITGIGLPTGQLNESIRSHKADEGLRSQVNNLRQQELNLALQQRRDQQQALAQQQSIQAMVNDAARRLNKMPPSMRAQELATYRETNPDLFRLIAPMFQEESTGVLKGGGGNIGGSATGSGGRSRGGTPTDGTIAYTESNKFNDAGNTAFVEGAVPTPMTIELGLIGQELNATNSGQRDAFSGIPTNATTGEIKEALIKSGVPADEVDFAISYVMRNTKGTKLTGPEIAQATYDSFRYQDPNFFSVKNMLGLDTGLSYDSDSATRAVNKANSKANRVIDAQSKKIEAQFNNLYQTDQRVQQLRAEARRARGDIELYASRQDMSDPETQDVVIRHSQNALNKEQEADKLEASNAKNLAAFKESLRAAQGNPSKEKTKVPQGKIVPRDTIPARIGRSPEKTAANKEEAERSRLMSRVPSNLNPNSLTIEDVMSLYSDEFPTNNSSAANLIKAANILKVIQGR